MSEKETAVADYLERVRAELIRQMIHGREDEPGRQEYAEAFANLEIANLRRRMVGRPRQ